MLLVWRKNDFDNFDILNLLLIGIFLNWIISSLIILKKIKSLNKFKQNLFSYKELINTAFPMMITSVSTILLISLPIFFLDYFYTQIEVGIFSVVYQISMLISVVMIIINTIVAPKFSELYWANKIVTLQRFINQSVNLMFLIAMFSSVTVIFFSDYILNIFGSEFLLGKNILIILVIGQLVSSSCGSVGILMNMVGKQKVQRNINLIALIICFFLYLLIVPKYGLMGSSIVFMFGLVFKNIISTIYIKKKMGLNTFFNPFNKI
jgi:O-antigen/teichoic acid export membrane protein